MKKKFGVLILTVILVFAPLTNSNNLTLKNNVYALDLTETEYIQEANEFIEVSFGISNYYPPTSANGYNLRVAESVEYGGVYLVYGTPEDVPDNDMNGGQYRYWGYTNKGEKFPNPDCPPDSTAPSGYRTDWLTPWDIISGRVIPAYRWYSEPSPFDAEFSKGDLVDLHRELQERDDINLTDIFYVIVPPTRYSWGLVVAYHLDSSRRQWYTTSLVKPYDLRDENIFITGSDIPTSGTGGSAVNVTVNVLSTFSSGDGAVPCELTVKNINTGAVVVQQNSTVNFSSEKNQVFTSSFTMPSDGAAEVTFAINKNGTSPPEGYLDDNTVTENVSLTQTRTLRGDYTIEYNVLRKYVSFDLYEGFNASNVRTGNLILRRGEWYESPTGRLVITNDNPAFHHTVCDPGCGCPCGTTGNCTCSRSCYNYFAADRRYPISEDSPEQDSYTVNTDNSFGDETLDVNPKIYGSFRRTDYGDKPTATTAVYKPNGELAKSGEISAKWVQQFNAGYRWWVRTDTGGFWRYGRARLDLDNISRTTDVVCKVYNGAARLTAPVFENEIENNEDDSNTKNLLWASTPLDVDVIRNMYYENNSGRLYNMTHANGQYVRKFIEQNQADLTWNIESGNSVSNELRDDRNAAKARNYNVDAAEKAVFASDTIHAAKEYPIRSGYFFNPAGTYTFTLNTQIYKNTNAETREHKDLVNAVINSFRYESNMVYVNPDTKQAVDISNNALSAAGSDIAGRTAYIGYAGNDLVPVTVETEFNVEDVEELAHRYPTLDEDTAYNSAVGEDITDLRFQAVLEGYAGSDTDDSRSGYRYTEYVKDGEHMYKISESTTVTITVNPDNQKLYTHAQMKNADYKVRAYIDSVNLNALTAEQLRGLSVSNGTGTLQGINVLDEIDIQVVGSAYDDRR
ncbi:MAG: hypothetical protein LBS21_04525 [Clostridiales bacterium]|nr:hypothetical protein [Clostridiales bacterium]